ncbi:carbamoyl-phosphate synthase, large subunit [Batrachochytrium salamandrivorans]|nr:carbamoyl-phosphate synthase, large subunit [Batrachochytrium salamandrivorans]
MSKQQRFFTSSLNHVKGSPRSFVGSSMGSGGLRTAVLTLEDGSKFHGVSFGAESSVAGEIVFNTGMVGYPEALTDPSYKGQLLVSTYPLQGNYGVPSPGAKDQWGLSPHFESTKIHASAYIVSDYSHHYANWEAGQSLSSWLQEEGIPGLYGIDTRLLTKKIRDRGAMLATIEFQPSYVPPGYQGIEFSNPNQRNLVAEVSCKERIVYGQGNSGPKILALDCGIKNNILRGLLSRGAEVHRVPWNFPFAQEMDQYDGLFLSNGPGDPKSVEGTVVKEIQKVLGSGFDKPIFGICMGNQVLGMAAGAQTYKLPFGNRGQNQPVVNLLTNRCYITPQNHGYALDVSNLPQDWKPLFVNRNDGSNEGIMHTSKPWFTAQFHPEARGGPTDTSFLFDTYLDLVKSGNRTVGSSFGKHMGDLRLKDVKKVLVLGSGGLSIGQAGEFDYSGSQAIKALKEEGLHVVLMNPNIASVQTNLSGSEHQADQVYFTPVTKDVVEEVIKREKPDSIILSMGGQTALNVGIELYESGILDKYKVRVLGTSVESIIWTEDRGLFNMKLEEIGEKLAPSVAVTTVEDAVKAATTHPQIGFPCMIRSAFALGGLGSGICENEADLRAKAKMALSGSSQILVERSMLGWKELEYEVVRDAADNCITVCNMENFDPLGVHTGDSIVVAPSQTLSNEDYHMLRDTAIKVVRHLKIVGECNIQYALSADSKEYCIIEVNPRLSRSSALASKATGYPLAFVAAKLGLGFQLPDLRNAVTHTTTACFEPSLDYCVVKVPRWDLTKFDRVKREIGSSMKSVGEVMAIGRTFEEGFQKALRMVDNKNRGFEPHAHHFSPPKTDAELEQACKQPSDTRVFALAYAMQVKGWSPERIHELTKIDTWFLYKLFRVVRLSTMLESLPHLNALNATLMSQCKKSGFSDQQIASRIGGGTKESAVRTTRKSMGVLPVVKQIDTMAGETPANTNYLYMTYNGDESDVVPQPNQGTMVLGSGCYRIGSSVEFDWCSVSAIRTLKSLGKKSIMVNYNPETVSTDYDECDRLYFEELSLERVLDIHDFEQPSSTFVSVGGQIPNTIALPLHENGVKIAGTSPDDIDRAEDRDKFSRMCDEEGIDQPRWSRLTSTEAAFDFADEVGYPVLVRPSYVLSGAAMNVAWTPAMLSYHLKIAGDVSDEHPVVISQFIENGREIDLDAVAKDGQIVCHAISEHIESAGVHSGDATLVLPPFSIDEETKAACRETARKVAKALNVTGPMNMQLIAKNGTVKIIEANIRASRSFPFSSKTVGGDFAEASTYVMLGMEPPKWCSTLDLGLEGTGSTPQTYFGVKAPMFSFKRLAGADPTLGVEMASTGEVACYASTSEAALLNALLATLNFKLPSKKKVLISIQEKLREDFAPSFKQLNSMGYEILATEETAAHIEKLGIPVTRVRWAHEPETTKNHGPSVDQVLMNQQVDFALMFSNQSSKRTETNYQIRRLAVDFGVSLFTDIHVAIKLTDALTKLSEGKIHLEAETLSELLAKEAKHRAA